MNNKKHFIDFNICADCEHYINGNGMAKCALNNIKLAIKSNLIDNIAYISVDTEFLKNIDEKLVDIEHDSLIENLDERCPRKLEHFVKCQNKSISKYEKIEKKKKK